MSRAFMRPLFRKDCVVYAKPPFGGPQHVLHYLARYTQVLDVYVSRDNEVTLIGATEDENIIRVLSTTPSNEAGPMIRTTARHTSGGQSCYRQESRNSRRASAEL